MATLVYGPRLGNPSSGGFTVWLCFDGAATLDLQVRKTGALTWTTVDTQAADAAQGYTVVLTVTGLEAATKYYYRVVEGATTYADYHTVTMPSNSGGTFVSYIGSDTHGTLTLSLAQLYTDWSTNYDPISMPCVFFFTGDYWSTTTTGLTAATFLTSSAIGGYANSQTQLDALNITKYVPTCYIFGDWDYGGNNSTRLNNTTLHNFTTAAEARAFYNYIWRDNPQPALPSFGYSVVIGGVPFILVDERSQKANVSTAGVTYTGDHIYDWRGPSSMVNQAWGPEQKAWMISECQRYAERGAVILMQHSTFKDNVKPNITPYTAGGARDSVGIYHRAERNEFLEALLPYGYNWRNNLLVFTGDDHWNCVWNGIAGENTAPGDATWPNFQANTASIGIPFKELKTSLNYSATTENAGKSPVLFGEGDWFSYHTKGMTGGTPGCAAYVRCLFNTSHDGTQVKARISYIVSYRSADNIANNPTDTTVPGDIMLDDLARPGDFYYYNGYFAYWDTTSTEQASMYPPDNGPGRMTFYESYVDDILGTLHKRTDMIRNTSGELRRSDDTEDVDRDDILETWCIPTESVTENEP